ncbi:MAG: type IX secretion system sortase PorU [Sphingobacteriia bacterium]
MAKNAVFIYLFYWLLPFSLAGQASFTSNSVLSVGNWGKIGVTKEGIYKVDLAMLGQMGLPNGTINSNSIRLYGNGGSMLAENTAQSRIDDLAENAIEIVDEGDGVFNGNDYLLFYAAGPHQWTYDSSKGNFNYTKHLYSDTAYYFITINTSASGKRIIVQAPDPANPSVQINQYTDRYGFETDLYNLLNSGKEWVGENFSTSFGGTLSRTFPVNFSGLILNEPLQLTTHFTGRSVGTNAQFNVSLNGINAQTINIPTVSGDLLGAYAKAVKTTTNLLSNQATLSLTMQFQSAAAGAEGWLNSFSITGRRALAFTENTVLRFRDTRSVQNIGGQINSVGQFNISNAPVQTMAWDISNPFEPIKLSVTQNGSILSFKNSIQTLKEYIAFTSSQFSTPIIVGKINNQNLHNTPIANGIIITHPTLLTAANRLAAFHLQQYGFKDAVITIDQIYNEFSSGTPDVTAIRDYIKFMRDKASSASTRPSYVVLLGAGSFDPKNRINNNINLVPVFESANSLEPLLTYTSDDFFGLIGAADDINTNSATPISISVGRLPVNNLAEAQIMVDKIIGYHSAKSLGDWRKEMILLADDQDNNLHLNDAESIASSAVQANPLFHTEKIYLDAYPLVSGAGGARYPAVNEAIVNSVFKGGLIFNYSGHGNYLRLTEEAVFSSTEVNRFNNPNKLPLFITASCDFAPHDDPTKQSLGEKLLFGNYNGGIALLTTTRLVFASSNRIMNENYIQTAFTRNANGAYLSLGEAVQIAKNKTMQNNGDVFNARKFSLLGDPAMQLAFPKGNIKINSINNKPITPTDSLQSLGKYTIQGEIQTASGTINSNFNGTVYPIIYDKNQTIKTLGNTPGSPVTNVGIQKSILFSGKATVVNGIFNFSFVLPKDIQFQPGNGIISLYAENGITDAAGSTSIKISGSNSIGTSDSKGPEIQLFINDTLFKNGGLSNERPILVARLSDSSGINSTGNSIGHDIIAVIDGDERNSLVLNDYFSYNTNSYQSGQLSFQLPTLKPGKHSIRLKAWDVLNNSNEQSIELTIAQQEKLIIGELRNFPNPFSTSTQFAFEHNQPNTNLLVDLYIYNNAGQRVKSIKRLVNTEGTRNVQISWAGDSDSGQKLVKGIYFYRIIVVAGAQQTQSAGQLLLY